MSTKIRRIRPRVVRTHLALFVTDPFFSSQWYQRVLGMEETARDKDWAFLSFGVKHHDIALIRAAPGAHQGGLGLQHFGLEIDGGLDELRRLLAQLIDAGVEVVKTTDHKIGVGVYFSDPDGHRFEFFHESVADNEEGKRVLGEYNAPSDPIDLRPLRD